MKHHKKNKEFCLIEGTIYPFDILISTANEKDLFKFIEKKKRYKLVDEEKEAMRFKESTQGKTINLLGGPFIIRMKKQKTITGVDMADLVHEIEHVCYMLFDRIGMKHSSDSDEAYAYFQAYIMRRFLDFCCTS